MESKFNGIYSAIFSIYDDELNVKKDTVAAIAEYHLDSGLQGFYVCGNTGECTVLPEKTRREMLETLVDVNKGRGQIIAHIGAGHYDETCRLVDHANTFDIDAIATLPPSLSSYYNAEETLSYYYSLAERSKVPLIAYITPVLRGDPVAFAEKLIKIPNVAGIKLTISDYYAFGAITSLCAGKADVLNGPDETMLCGLSLGAQGAIGTSYNFAPKQACEIYNRFKAGDMEGALVAQRRLNKFIDLGVGSSIALWKAILELRGFDVGHTVFPCTPVSAEKKQELKVALANVGFFD